MLKDSAITVDGLCYSYSQSRQRALDGVNFSVQQGSFVALVGPSGCGKTTLLLLLRGFAKEFGGELSGRIGLFGRDISSQTIAQLGDKVAIVFQNPSTQLHQLTVGDEIASSMIYRNFPYPEIQEKAGRQVEKFLGKGFASKSPQELSGGQQQRVALAAALSLDAPIVLLDEPFSFLDSKSAREILGILLQLKKQGKTIVLSTHHIGMITPVADMMLLMDNGKIVLQGPPEKVLYDPSFAKVLPPPLPVRIGKQLRKRILSWEPLLEKMKGRRKPESQLQHEPGKLLLEVANLTFSYAGKQAAVRNASLSVSRGEIFGLVGANGSGKTTLAKCVLGLLKPQKGKVILSGQDITTWDTSRRAKAIGFVTQDPRDMFCEMNLADEVAFGPKNFGIPEPKKKAESMLGKLSLSAMKDRHPDSLSGGQKSLLGLADILVSEPEILVLDEPEFGLDPGSWGKITGMLKGLGRQGRAIVIITQDLEAVMFLCGRCALMKNGELIAAGTPKSILGNKKLLESAGLMQLPIFGILPFVSSSALENENAFIDETAKLLKW